MLFTSKTLCSHRWIDWHHCCFFNSMLIEAFVWIVVIVLSLKEYAERRENPSIEWNGMHYTVGTVAVCIHDSWHIFHFVICNWIAHSIVWLMQRERIRGCCFHLSSLSFFNYKKHFNINVAISIPLGTFHIEFPEKQKKRNNRINSLQQSVVCVDMWIRPMSFHIVF